MTAETKPTAEQSDGNRGTGVPNQVWWHGEEGVGTPGGLRTTLDARVTPELRKLGSATRAGLAKLGQRANVPAAPIGQLPDRLAAAATHLRLPEADDPAPDPRRLMLVSAWAALLGAGGALLAIPLLFSLFRTHISWYTPTIIGVGAVGIAATMAAFTSISRTRAPFVLLGVGTAALAAGFVLTAVS